MSSDKPSTAAELDDSDPLSLRKQFPDALNLLSIRRKPIEAIKSTCLVVLDTNSLLVPYTVSQQSLQEIERKFADLLRGNRLFVPAHVVREFAVRRATKIAELHHALCDKKSRATPFTVGTYPLLEALPEYQALLSIQSQLAGTIADYATQLDHVIRRIREWCWDDPVSEVYSRLFAPPSIVDASLSDDELKKDIECRHKARIPPGYKDSNKAINSGGDIAIWHTILDLGRQKKNDVVFVSGEQKTDWWHRSGGQTLYPRFELLEEFHRVSEGHAFHIVRFSDFLDIYHVKESVVQEVRTGEAVQQQVFASRSKRHVYVFHQRATAAAAVWLSEKFPHSRISKEGGRRELRVTLPGGTSVVASITLLRRGFMQRALSHAMESLTRGSELVSTNWCSQFIVICIAEEEAVLNGFVKRIGVMAIPEGTSITAGLLEHGGRFEPRLHSLGNGVE